MALMDEPVRRGKIYSGGWAGGDLGPASTLRSSSPATGQEIGRTGIATPSFGGIGASGTGARFGGAANLDAFTDTRWVSVRGDVAPYPF